MSDETEIPKEFDLQQQIEEIESIFREKRDFIEKKVAMRKMGEPEANLARYRLARVVAIGRTLRGLTGVEEKPPATRQALPPQEEQQPEPPKRGADIGWDD